MGGYNILRRIYLYYIIFFIAFGLSCRNGFQYPIEKQEITDRIVTYECISVKVAAIKGEKGYVVIDTHRCPAIMLEIQKRIEKDFGIDECLFVINTHGHADHASGNQVFPDSIVVGHEKCPRFMKRNPADHRANTWYVREKLAQLKIQEETSPDVINEIGVREIMLKDLEENYRTTPPALTFADSLALDAGDITVKLYYSGNNHTNNDIIVYIPELRTVFTGDLFNTRSSYSFTVHKLIDIPRLTGIIGALLDADGGIDRVLSGHTAMMTRDDLAALKKLLEERYEPFKDETSAAGVLKDLLMEYEPSRAVAKYGKFRQGDAFGYYCMEEEFNALGKQLFWEGNESAAVAALRVGLAELPGSALLCDNLAGIYVYVEKIDSAIYYYKKSLDLFPENRNAAEALQAIISD